MAHKQSTETAGAKENCCLAYTPGQRTTATDGVAIGDTALGLASTLNNLSLIHI